MTKNRIVISAVLAVAGMLVSMLATLLLSVLVESAMSAPLGAPPTGEAEETTPVGSPVNTSPSSIMDYWTRDRMSSAAPAPWPKFNAAPSGVSPAPIKLPTTTGPATAVDGNTAK